MKGTVPLDFRNQVFYMEQFPQAPDYTIRADSNFSKIRGDIRSWRCTTGVFDTGGKCKKSSIRKVSIIYFGHLWVVELAYTKIFSFKFTFSCQQQSDIVPIVCHRCRWHRWQKIWSKKSRDTVPLKLHAVFPGFLKRCIFNNPTARFGHDQNYALNPLYINYAFFWSWTPRPFLMAIPPPYPLLWR